VSTVRLEVLVEGSPPGLLAAVGALAVAPGQEDFVLLPQVTLPAALDDPGRTPFAVLAGHSARSAGVVGFGVLDRHGYLDQVLDQPERTVLLRAFCIGARHQGRGLGAAAARAARSLGARVAPSAELVVLSVHAANTAGQRAYARAGYADTGARYAGSCGAEHVMAATVLHAAGRGAQLRASTGSRSSRSA
jgi:RimJ/RimL family protein N-acetyltransferase